MVCRCSTFYNLSYFIKIHFLYRSILIRLIAVVLFGCWDVWRYEQDFCTLQGHCQQVRQQKSGRVFIVYVFYAYQKKNVHITGFLFSMRQKEANCITLTEFSLFITFNFLLSSHLSFPLLSHFHMGFFASMRFSSFCERNLRITYIFSAWWGFRLHTKTPCM